MDEDQTRKLFEHLDWEKFDREFPDAVHLAKFSQLCYSQKLQKDLQSSHFYGWEVLKEKSVWWCAYRGIAFINHGKKQIVLAHRGTKFFNILNWISNLAVLYYFSTGFQLWQASLLAEEVSTFAQEKGYQLIITGHSMGGVLAQVTAFSTKYLQIKNGAFAVKDVNHFSNIHPHVECFDSPGTYKIIRNLIATLQEKIYGNVFDRAPSRLDILNYVVSPNIPNTNGVHIGTVVCVDKKGLKEQPRCWVGNHPIRIIIKLLQSKDTFAGKMTCWGEAVNLHDETFSRTCIPDYCLTSTEIEMIEYVQKMEDLQFDFGGVNILKRVHFVVKRDRVRMLNLPDEALDCKFIPFMHFLKTNSCLDILQKQTKKQLCDPQFVFLKYPEFDFSRKEIYSLKISDIPQKEKLDQTQENVEFQCTTMKQARIFAVMLRNHLFETFPRSHVVIFPNSADEDKVKKQVSAMQKSRSQDDAWIFVLVKNDTRERHVEDLVHDLGSTRFVTVIYNGLPEADPLSFDSLSAESKNIVQDISVGLQNEENKIKMSIGSLKETPLLELVERYISGCLLPKTWQSIESDYTHKFYVSQYLKQQDEKVDIQTMLNEKSSAMNVVVAKPGMGKTSLLTELRARFAARISENDEEILVLLVSLRKLNPWLEKENSKLNEKSILADYLNLDPTSAEYKLFYNILSKDKPSVVFLFDGFDEVWTSCRTRAQDFIGFFRKQKYMYQIWVSTRYDTLHLVEDESFKPLQTFGLDLFTEAEQKTYLKKLLEEHKRDSAPTQENVDATYTKMLAISKEFGEESLGVPLTLKLLVLADAHKSDAKFIKPHNLIEMYLDKKRQLFLVEKLGKSKGSISKAEVEQFRRSYFCNLFIFYALHQIFQDKHFIKEHREIDLMVKDDDALQKLKDCGLLDGENNFLHRTIAEYLLAYAIKIVFGIVISKQHGEFCEWLQHCLVKLPSNCQTNSQIFAIFLKNLRAKKISNMVIKYLDDMVLEHFGSGQKLIWLKSEFNSVLNEDNGWMINFLANKAFKHKSVGIFYLLTKIIEDNNSINAKAKFMIQCGHPVDVHSPSLLTVCRSKSHNKLDFDTECENAFILLDSITSETIASKEGPHLEKAVRDTRDHFAEFTFEYTYQNLSKIANIMTAVQIDEMLSFATQLKRGFARKTLVSIETNPELSNLFQKLCREMAQMKLGVHFSLIDRTGILATIFEKNLFKTLQGLTSICDILDFNKYLPKFLRSGSRQEVPLLVQMICHGREDVCIKMIEKNSFYLEEAVDFCNTHRDEILKYIAFGGMNKLFAILKPLMLATPEDSKKIDGGTIVLSLLNEVQILEYPPLYIAIKRSNVELIRGFIDLGYQVDLRNFLPKPLVFALHLFFQGCDSMTEVIATLVQHGALKSSQSDGERLLEIIKAEGPRTEVALSALKILSACEEYAGKYLGVGMLETLGKSTQLSPTDRECHLQAIGQYAERSHGFGGLTDVEKETARKHMKKCRRCAMNLGGDVSVEKVGRQYFILAASRSAVCCGDLKWLDFLLHIDSDFGANTFTSLAMRYSFLRIDDLQVHRFLLDNGSDIEMASLTLQGALHNASLQDLKDLVKLLLDNGANPEAKDIQGMTPLHVAVKFGSMNVLPVLLSVAEVDVNCQNNWGNTPLHLACMTGNIDAARVLVSKGANLDARDFTWATPLHDAVRSTKLPLVDFLLNSGVNADLLDLRLQSPLDLAYQYDLPEIQMRLLSQKKS